MNSINTAEHAPVRAPETIAISLREVADELRVSVQTIRNLIARGDLKSFRIGDRVLVPNDELRRFVADRVA
jgi:excisionase family DNA binding protein